MDRCAFQNICLLIRLHTLIAGINKLGGTAWILLCHDTEEGILYDVKYVLDSTSDTYVPAIFVEPFVELARTNRRSTIKSNESKTSSLATSTSTSSDLNTSQAKNKKSRKRNVKVLNGESSVSNSSNDNASANSNARRSDIVILTSAASFEIECSLEIFSQRFACPPHPSIRVVSRFDSTVTHLVVSVGRDNVLKQRTMKYMLALVCKDSYLTGLLTLLNLISELYYFSAFKTVCYFCKITNFF